jgi:hypothetical protein
MAIDTNDEEVTPRLWLEIYKNRLGIVDDAELSQLLGVTARTIGTWAAGRTMPIIYRRCITAWYKLKLLGQEWRPEL